MTKDHTQTVKKFRLGGTPILAAIRLSDKPEKCGE
jgi:hypothetical protein